jgi:hypothetical protein
MGVRGYVNNYNDETWDIFSCLHLKESQTFYKA